MKLFLIFLICYSVHIEATGLPKLLFANRKDIRIVQLGKASKNILVKNVEDASSIDFYYKKKIICWTDVHNELIKCMSIKDGADRKNINEIKIISRGVISPDGIAIDWLTEKIYWADSEANTIEVAEIFSENRRPLFWKNLFLPRAIALVPSEGLMFWSDWGEKPKIEKAGMNGDPSTRKIIVNTDIEWPNGLTIDYESRVLFWADGKHSCISSVDFEGKNRVKVFGELPHPFAVTFFDKTLFWTDWSTKTIHYCHLSDKRKCSDHEKVNMTLSPMYIHVYKKERQPPTLTPCHKDNGGCSHLCLLAPNPDRYTCACPTGVRLIDKYNCEKGPEEMLLLARRSDIRRISLDTPDRTAVVLPVEDIEFAIAIDYDPVDEYVYWTDDKAFTIRRVHLNGTNHQVIIESEGLQADGVAIDWLGRNMYWSDLANNLIEVAKVDGTYRKILVRGELEKPRAIAVHPMGGLMFWSDWGSVPKIERACLDGSQRKTIVDTRIGWPNGIAVDYHNEKLYWVDANTHTMEVAELDGSNRQIILKDDLPHVFGFSLLGDYLYWTDWQKRSIERVHKNDSKQREILVEQLPNMMGLKAVSVKQKIGFSPCTKNNGGCAHLCFTKPNSQYVCGCAQGYELTNDGKSCEIPRGFIIYSHLNSIRRVSLKTQVDLNMLIPDVGNISSMNFDSDSDTIYWIDSLSKSIHRSPINGSRPTTIVKFGLQEPFDLAVDFVPANLYWTDKKTGRIEVSRLDGSSRRTILWNRNAPTYISVSQSLLYWIENESDIFTSNLDGSKPTLFVSLTGVIDSLIVDENYLYVANRSSRTIDLISPGGVSQAFINCEVKPKKLAIYDELIYWSNSLTNQIGIANKRTGEKKKALEVGSANVSELMVFQNRKKWESSCSRDSNLCSGLCFPSRSSFTCRCPSHYIAEAGLCTKPQSFLLVANPSSVTRLIVNTTEVPTMVVPVPGLKNVSHIDLDLNGNVLYYIENGSIKRAYLNGSQPEIFYRKEKFEPTSLVVDSGINVVFVACVATNRILAFRTDGVKVGNMLPNAMKTDKPSSLTLHSAYGLLYFINRNKSPTIDCITLSGPSRRVVIKGGLKNAQQIIVDEKSDLLYIFSDTTIDVSDLLGRNRKTVATGSFIEAHSPAIHGNFLYWATGDIISYLDMRLTSHISIIPFKSKVTGLAAISPTDYSRAKKHPCQYLKDCSHLCVTEASSYHNFVALDPLGVSSEGARCGCPSSMMPSRDRQTCVLKPQCPKDHFTCMSGSRNCIHFGGRCNGVSECSDGSDEMDCDKSVCGSSFFRCLNGQCVDAILKCDRRSDCMDESDELVCCPSGQTMCPSTGLCVMCEDIKKCRDINQNSCPYYRVHNKPEGHSTSSYIVGVLICFIVVIIIFGILLLYRRKPNLSNDHELETHSDALKTTQNRYRVVLSGGKVYTGVNGELQVLPNGHGLPSSKSMASGTSSTHQLLPEVVNVPLIRPGLITGGSSSSSSLTHYPRETMNPPPTPIAEPRPPHCCYSSSSSAVRSVMNSYRKYKSHNRPPPPTPCSTDVGDDSDFCSTIITPHCMSPVSNYSPPFTDYESEPYPPPPTPQTLFEGSCPPSPSTDRSYFIQGPCPSPLSASGSE